MRFVDLVHYHPWQGKLGSPWRGCWALMRTGLRQVFRRKGYWFLLSLALLNFLLFFAVIYLSTQLPVAFQRFVSRERILQILDFSAVPDEEGRNGYVVFIQRQSIVVMVLLAFCGSLLVGSDFQRGVLPFYLSRSISRFHYIISKLLTVSLLIWIVTIFPAFVLFIEYGIFSDTYDYWWENRALIGGILGYGVVLGGTLSIVLVTISAYLQRMAPIAIIWSSVFFLLRIISRILVSETENRFWYLLDPWKNIRYVGMRFFGPLQSAEDAELAPYAATIILTVSLLLLIALWRRVRAVEVVQ
ncbi:Hypothetical protein PBC10988_37840 [Planctomycetales bacterium 10988]|nr:Hypothetical protein PBC10988_37840 [Planctomycetales bacterium 10988]